MFKKFLWPPSAPSVTRWLEITALQCSVIFLLPALVFITVHNHQSLPGSLLPTPDSKHMEREIISIKVSLIFLCGCNNLCGPSSSNR